MKAIDCAAHILFRSMASDFTPIQLAVLCAVASGADSPSAISRTFGISPATAGGTLRLLRLSDYITQENALTNTHALTDKARNFLRSFLSFLH